MPSINTFNSLCSEDCGAVVQLPALAADQDCTGFDLYESQITDLYIQPAAAGASPWAATWTNGSTDITYTEANVDNTATDNLKCKWLVGAGGIEVPEKTTQELPKFKDRISKRTYTLTFTIQNVTDAQYEFGRALQCGDTSFTFWYANTHHVYGKAEGISPKSVDCDLPLDSARDGVEQMVITITWEAKTDPERKTNPR